MEKQGREIFKGTRDKSIEILFFLFENYYIRRTWELIKHKIN